MSPPGMWPDRSCDRLHGPVLPCKSLALNETPFEFTKERFVASSTTSSPGAAAFHWRSIGTRDQRLSLSPEQMSRAEQFQHLLDRARDRGTLDELWFDIIPDLELPEWLTDELSSHVKRLLDIPLVGSTEEWGSLSTRDRRLVHTLRTRVSQTRRRSFMEIAVAEEGIANHLPEWARAGLLVFAEQTCDIQPPHDAFAGGLASSDCENSCAEPGPPVDSGSIDETDDAATEAGEPREPDARNRQVPAERAARASGSTVPVNAGPSESEPADRFRVEKPWPDDTWGLPNALVRTALASSTKGEPGDYGPAPVRVASLSHTTLYVTGSRITQGDLEPFLMCIHVARHGDEIEMTPTRFLEGMQRGTSTRDVESLIKSFNRLRACQINISLKYRNTHRRKTWSGPLIQSFEMIEKETTGGGRKRVIRVTLDPKLAEFFGNDFTWVPVRDRAVLRAHRMCAGLHAFYSTHATPEAYNLETVRELLGVVVAGRDYERLLRAALTRLKDLRMIEAWQIEDRKLSVTPKPTPAKLRHLHHKGIVCTAAAMGKTCPSPAGPGSIRSAGFQTVLHAVCSAIGKRLSALQAAWDALRSRPPQPRSGV